MKYLRHLPLIVITAVTTSVVQSQTAVTDPVGFVTTTISASPNGTAFRVTPISPVLLQISGVSGVTAGEVSALTSNSVSIASAGWTAEELVSSQAYLLFKTGGLAGLAVRVTANTADTLTVDTFGANLDGLGGAAGDSVQLIQGDTVLSMFGTPADGVVGGTLSDFTAGATDRILVRDSSGVIRTLYYNTAENQWRRAGSSTNQGSIPISPLAGVLYYRIGQTALSHLSTGNVPTTVVRYLVPTSGVTVLARFFPTNGSISDFGFQNLEGWKTVGVNGVTIAQADKVSTTDSSGVVRNFYWNGTRWLRAGSSTDQSDTEVPIGGAVYVTRSGTGAAQLLTLQMPYSLAAQ
jgi:uncharacterized protein (TIGR02597 family)